MKYIYTSLLLLISAFTAAAADFKNELVVEPIEVSEGSSTSINVLLNNTEEIMSVAFDIILPSELEIVLDRKGKISFGTDLDRDYSVGLNDLNGSVSVVINGSYPIEAEFSAEGYVLLSLDVKANKTYKGVPGLNNVVASSSGVKHEIKYRIGEVGTNGYSTYSSIYNVKIVEGATSYYATVNEDVVTLTPTKSVKAEEGVVLKGTTGTSFYGVTLSSIPTDEVPSDNALKSSPYGKDVTNVHVLSTEQGVTGFYKYSGWVPAAKAYLVGVTGSKASIRFADETGIEEISAEDLDGVIFNLNGQKVNEVKKGIHIVNGKKVMF